MNAGNELLSKIETARMWSYFHKDWLLQMRLALRPQLPADYRIVVESESVIISPDPFVPNQAFAPDIAVTRAVERKGRRTASPTGATSAVIEVEEPCEIDTHYSLIIRRAPEHYIVAVAELLSPSNKGLGNRLDEQKLLRKRDEYLEAGVNLLEIDPLTEGRRTLPDAVSQLAEYDRIGWCAAHESGRRRYRGWGWNDDDPLPTIDWQVDPDHVVLIDTGQALKDAAEFNNWEAFLFER